MGGSGLKCQTTIIVKFVGGNSWAGRIGRTMGHLSFATGTGDQALKDDRLLLSPGSKAILSQTMP